jgi:RHS repeat-associated protein
MGLTRRTHNTDAPPRRLRRAGLTIIGISILALGLGTARAQSPSTTVAEQHFELTGRPIQVSSSPSVEAIHRGVLPWGTTKFNPQPTATFEVVAKTTAALSNGKWTVTLRDAAGGPLASVEFGASNSAYSIKTATVTWPTVADSLLADIRMTSSAPGTGDVAGVLDIRKAYVKIHQQGVIKAIVGRVPLAGYVEGGDGSAGWVEDTTWYKHIATDYNPAPTVKLRVTGIVTGGTGQYACIYDDDVAFRGSVLVGTTLGTYESGPLTLTGGKTYRLYDSCPGGGSGTLQILSADLVFEQSTTDALGLYKTVGWYPSVATPTALTATTDTDLDFKFRGPDRNVYATSRSWVATIKAGSAQTPSAWLSNSLATTAASTTDADYIYSEPSTLPTLPSANQTLDTRYKVAVAGRSSSVQGSALSFSALRLGLNLRDIDAPSLSSFSASPAIINPQVGGCPTTTSILVNATDPSPPLGYSIAITPTTGGSAVRTLAGSSASGGSIGTGWNGTNDANAIVDDGSYNATMTVTDSWNNGVTTGSASVIVDRYAPTVSLTSPAGSQINGQVSLGATATDNHAGVKKVEFYYRRVFSDATVGPWHLLDSDLTAPYGATLRTRRFADGAIEVGVKTEDLVCNVGAITDVHSLEVRNGEMLGSQSFGASRSWSMGDRLSLGVDPYWGGVDVSFNGGGVKAAGPRESVGLHYNSRNPRRSSLGFGWTFGMAPAIEAQPDGSAIVATGEGSRYRFASAGGGAYTRPAGVYLTLVHNGNGTYTLTDKAGIVRSFDAAGKPTSVVDRNGRTRTYAYTSGKLTSITNPFGGATILTYDGANRIATIKDSANRTTTIGYDAANEVTTITDAASKTFTFGYDSDHRLSTITDPLANVRTIGYSGGDDWATSVSGQAGASFGYGSVGAEFARAVAQSGTSNYAFNAAGAPTSITNALGKTQTFTRDADHNVTLRVDELGKSWRYEFDANGNRTKSRDPLQYAAGESVDYVYNALNLVTSKTDALNRVHTYVYDAAGRLTSEQSPRQQGTTKQTAYGYDGAGNLTTITNALSKITTFTYDGAGRRLTTVTPLGKTTTYTYDTAGRVATVKNPLNKIWSTTYDALGRVLTSSDPLAHTTTRTYDANGNQLTLTDAASKTTTFTYDAGGHVLTSTSPLGKQTQYGYDSNGRLTSARNPTSNWTYYGYDLLGRRITVQTPRGYVTTSAYDDAGNLTSATTAEGTTKYCYDDAGRRVKEIDPRGSETCATSPVGSYTSQTGYNLAGEVTSSTAPGNKVTRFGYDVGGNAITTDPRGSALGDAAYTTTTVLDDLDRVSTVTTPGRDPMTYSYDFDNRMTGQSDGTSSIVRVYDDASRLTDITDGDGNRSSFLYDNADRLTGYVDPRGNASGAIAAQYTTTFALDNVGRISTITNQLGFTRQFTYDADGRKLTETDPRGFATSFEYDDSGRLTKITDPENKAISFGYDINGNRTSVVDVFGTTALQYDELDRPKKTTMPDANSQTGGTIVVDRTYDAAGNPNLLTDPISTKDYDFNNLSQFQKVSVGGTAVHTYDPYDAAGNPGTAITPVGTLTHGFDATNRQTSVSGWDSASFTYDDRGLPTTLVDGAGYREQITTSPGGAPTQVVFKQSATGPTDVTFALTYDEGQRPKTITRDSVLDRSFTYDRAGRPTSEQYRIASGLQTVNYAYDQAGNRISRTLVGGVGVDTFTYSNAGKLTATSTGGVPTTYTSDDNGNLTSGTGANTQTLKWGAGNQLLSVQKGTSSVNFTYDGNGQIAKRQVNTATTYLWRFDQGRLEAIQTQGTPPATQTVDSLQFLYGQDGTPLSVRAPGGQVFHYHYDAFGSVERITKGTQLAVRYQYDNFGNIVETQTGAAYDSSLLSKNPFRFMGRYQLRYDPELNLYEQQGRFYDPVLGRYLSRDTSGRFTTCWIGTCAPPSLSLVPAGVPVDDPTSGGRCDSKIEQSTPVGYTTEQTMVNCTAKHAHIVVDFLELNKGFAAAPGDADDQRGNSYQFLPGDSNDDHDHDDAGTAAHALLLHSFSCDNCRELQIPFENPLGIPCGDTKSQDVPGIPKLWGTVKPDGTTNGVAKSCTGREWYAVTRVHFIPANAWKNPTDGKNNYLWEWQYKPTTWVKNTPEKACGVHEYPGGKAPDDPAGNVLYGAGQVVDAAGHGWAGVRDFASYNMGVGVICYVDAMMQARS